MDIRGLEGFPQSSPVDPRQHRVIKKGEAFPTLKPETFTSHVKQEAAASDETSSPVTQEEKDFFAALFPDASSEIASHKTYSPSGLRGLAQTGRMVDRKG
jgi:hypothetical protein